jgi:hypothetical protein
MVSLMDVKEAFTQEMSRVLLDMMERYVDHVVKVTQIYIFQSIIIIQSFLFDNFNPYSTMICGYDDAFFNAMYLKYPF